MTIEWRTRCVLRIAGMSHMDIIAANRELARKMNENKLIENDGCAFVLNIYAQLHRLIFKQFFRQSPNMLACMELKIYHFAP